MAVGIVTQILNQTHKQVTIPSGNYPWPTIRILNPNDGVAYVRQNADVTGVGYGSWDYKVPSQSFALLPGEGQGWQSVGIYYLDQSGSGAPGELSIYLTQQNVNEPLFQSIGRAIVSQTTSMDIVQGAQPASPGAGIDRLWADVLGNIHHLHNNGQDFTLIDNGTVLGGVLTGTLPNPGLAAGVASGNIGALGGVLTGTLPNPGLAPLPQSISFSVDNTYDVGSPNRPRYINAASAVYTPNVIASATLALGGGGGTQWGINTTTLYPTLDNTIDIGGGGNRVRNLFFGGSVIGPLVYAPASANFNFGANGGVQWTVQTGGSLITQTDNAFDIGAGSSNRPRSLYLGTSLNFGGVPGYGAIYAVNGPLYLGATSGAAAVNSWLINANGNLWAYQDNTVDIGTNGSNRPRNLYTYSWIMVSQGKANYLLIDGAATGNYPYIAAQGSDAYIGVDTYVMSGSAAAIGLRVAPAASSPNTTYAVITPSTTATTAVTYGVAGPNPDIHLILQSKGTGGIVTTTGPFRVVGNVGFYNTSPAAKQTIVGSRGGNAALTNLLAALAVMGLVTDSSSP